jgi:hypothetical protein
VNKDPTLSEARRKELSLVYADRALGTLSVAIKNGYQDVANMKQDGDLDPLRKREDFKKLLAALEATKKGK